MVEKETIIGLGLLIVLLGVLLFAVSGFWGNTIDAQTIQTQTVVQGASAQSTIVNGEKGNVEKSNVRSNEGEVSVDLEPEKFEAGKFYVKMSGNTHTVNNLNTYDLREITTLVYKGKEYKPSEATGLQGHHSAGKLVFLMPEEPKAFSIRITDLADKGVREFTWP